ncbi:unnamed protein product [Phytomonas sp. EM1]|nr:unnamed protein product [Phytomonas sp. EM1]|eukprot:CCW61464.1 unnamed protein product [Phytomonas sp. isolate EM1]
MDPPSQTNSDSTAINSHHEHLEMNDQKQGLSERSSHYAHGQHIKCTYLDQLHIQDEDGAHQYSPALESRGVGPLFPQREPGCINNPFYKLSMGKKGSMISMRQVLKRAIGAKNLGTQSKRFVVSPIWRSREAANQNDDMVSRVESNPSSRDCSTLCSENSLIPYSFPLARSVSSSSRSLSAAIAHGLETVPSTACDVVTGKAEGDSSIFFCNGSENNNLRDCNIHTSHLAHFQTYPHVFEERPSSHCLKPPTPQCDGDVSAASSPSGCSDRSHAGATSGISNISRAHTLSLQDIQFTQSAHTTPNDTKGSDTPCSTPVHVRLAVKPTSANMNRLNGEPLGLIEKVPDTNHFSHKISTPAENFIDFKIDALTGIKVHCDNYVTSSLQIIKTSKTENPSVSNVGNAFCSMLSGSKVMTGHPLHKGDPKEEIPLRFRSDNRLYPDELLFSTPRGWPKRVTHINAEGFPVHMRVAKANIFVSPEGRKGSCICSFDTVRNGIVESGTKQELIQHSQIPIGTQDVQPATNIKVCHCAGGNVNILQHKFDHTGGQGMHYDHSVASLLYSSITSFHCVHALELLKYTREVILLESKLINNITEEFVRSFDGLTKVVAYAPLPLSGPAEVEYPSCSNTSLSLRLQGSKPNADNCSLLFHVKPSGFVEAGQQLRISMRLKVNETKPPIIVFQKRQRRMISLSTARRRCLTRLRNYYFMSNRRSTLLHVAGKKAHIKGGRGSRNAWVADSTNYEDYFAQKYGMRRIADAYKAQKRATTNRFYNLACIMASWMNNQELRHTDTGDAVTRGAIDIIEVLSDLMDKNMKFIFMLGYATTLLKEEQLYRFHIEEMQVMELRQLICAHLCALDALQTNYICPLEATGSRTPKEETYEHKKKPLRGFKYTTFTQDRGQLDLNLPEIDLLEESERIARHTVFYPGESRERKGLQLLFRLGLAGLIHQEDALKNRLNVPTREALTVLTYLQRRKREEIHIQEICKRARLYELAAGWFYTQSSSTFLEVSRENETLRDYYPSKCCAKGTDEQAKGLAEIYDSPESSKKLVPEGTLYKANYVGDDDTQRLKSIGRDQTHYLEPYVKDSDTTGESKNLMRNLCSPKRILMSSGVTPHTGKTNANTITETSNGNVEDLMDDPEVKLALDPIYSGSSGQCCHSSAASSSNFQDGGKAAFLLHALRQTDDTLHFLRGDPSQSEPTQNWDHQYCMENEQESEGNVHFESDEEYWSTEVICGSSASSLRAHVFSFNSEEKDVMDMDDGNILIPPDNLGGVVENKDEQTFNFYANRSKDGLSHTDPPIDVSQYTADADATPEYVHKEVVNSQEAQPVTSMPPLWDCVEVITNTSLHKTPTRRRALCSKRSCTPPLNSEAKGVSASPGPSDRFSSATRLPTFGSHGYSKSPTKRYMKPTTSSIFRTRDTTPIQASSCSPPPLASSLTSGSGGVSRSRSCKRCYGTRVKVAVQESDISDYPIASPVLITRLPLESGPGIWSQVSSSIQPRNPYGYSPRAQQALAASLMVSTPPRCVLATTLPETRKASTPCRVNNRGRVVQIPPREGPRNPISEVASCAEDKTHEHEQRRHQERDSFELSCPMERSVLYLPESMRRAFHVPQYIKISQHLGRVSTPHTRAMPCPSAALLRRSTSVGSYANAMHDLGERAIQQRCAAIATSEGVSGRPIRDLPQPFCVRSDCTTLMG